MTIPPGFVVQSVLDSQRSTVKSLQDLQGFPYISIPKKQILFQALESLGTLLSKFEHESWTLEQDNLALQSLEDALQKTSSLASKWKERRIRLLLNMPTFVDELIIAVIAIQDSCVRLQSLENHKEEAVAIAKQLGVVVQGLTGGISGSDLNAAGAEFKKELLEVLRVHHSKSKTSDNAIPVNTWLTRYFGVEAHSIRQELLELKEHAHTLFPAKWEVGTELLYQLLLHLTEIEDESVILAKVKAKLICTVCNGPMVCPVLIDSGISLCKACVEERYRFGPVVNRYNGTLQNVIACFGEAEEPSGTSEPFTGDGESSDASFDSYLPDDSLERRAQIGLEKLVSSSHQKVMAGFSHLIKCASLPGGSLAVFNATLPSPASAPQAASPTVIEAVPIIIEKAKQQDPQISKRAVKLLAALTSDIRGASDTGPHSDLFLEVADALDILVSLMKADGLTPTHLLAAQTVVNLLVNKEIRKTVLKHDGVIPALVALWNVDPADQSAKEANSFCLKGLQYLTKCNSEIGDNPQAIVSALINLLKRGLDYKPELDSLVRDSLVALESQVLAREHATSTNEICEAVWKERSEILLIRRDSVSPTSVPGRMAIINIMTKLCDLYKEGIDQHMFLYLVKVIEITRSEIADTLEQVDKAVAEQMKTLTELLVRSVRLLCFCVTHGKNTAESVLNEYPEVRRTMGTLLELEEASGILDESRLEILSVLERIDPGFTQTKVVKILVDMSKSQNQCCRQKVAKKFRMLVKGQQHFIELQQAGGVAVLVALLQDLGLDLNCRRDALVALYALTSSMEIPVSPLPKIQTTLYFLRENGDVEVTNAAAGLFALMLKERAVNAEEFLQTEGVLEAILNLLYSNADSPGSERSASTILEMAKEDRRVRTRIAQTGLRGLDILVPYVQREQCPQKIKELLTATLVQLCRDGENFQEAVIEANGDTFLLASLQEKISREEAAQGLLELVKNPKMIERIPKGLFVRTAMGSISQTFAYPAIAQGLSHIASTDEGLNQIYSALSDSKLRTLLEKCPDHSGQDAAASIIAKLYPLLCRRAEDLPRLNNLITETCPVLLKSLKRFDPNHVKESLQALAAFATCMWGRRMIHETLRDSTLIDHLSTGDTEIQGLVLKTLLKMTSDVPENDENRAANTIIIEAARNMFFHDYKIRDQLLSLVKSEEFCRPERTESMMDALNILRNLSLGGPYRCDGLVDQGAVNALLTVLKRPESPSPIVTELALTALEKLLNGSKGKQDFMSKGGIEPLVAILKADAFVRGAGIESVSSIVLTLFVGSGDGKQTGVARDEKHRKSACDAIFKCDILAGLSQIIFDHKHARTRWQAAFLIKLLAMYGPTARVIADIKKNEYFHALIQLRGVEHCQSMADTVLEFLRSKDATLRKKILQTHR